MTLMIPVKGKKILLGRKKRGFGNNRWNGFGGKLHEGEDVETAARRELKEEAGITPLDFEKTAIIEFDYQHTGDVVETHLFCVRGFQGEVAESEEMEPKWFLSNFLPFNEMWPDDRHWMPFFLSGKKFRAKFVFSDYDTIINYTIKEVENLCN